MAKSLTLTKRIQVVGLLLLAAFAVGFITFYRPESTRKYPDRIPVRFWHRWGGEWAAVVARIADRYNESQSKYEVIPLSIPGGAADSKLMLGSIGGDPPDVMSMWNGAIPNMAANGILTPLEEVMSPGDLDLYMNRSYPVIRDSGMFRNKIYGVTIGSDLYAIYVNEDELRNRGVDPDRLPTTLEEFCELGRRLNEKDARGNLSRLGFLIGQYSYLVYSFGGSFYDPKSNELTIQTPENLRALEFIVKERQAVGQEQISRFYAGLNTGSDTGGWPFITDQLLMTMDGQWRVEELRKYAPNKRYRVIPIPPPAQGGRAKAGTVSGNFMVIPKSAKQKEGAWEFIRFWSGFADPEASAQAYNDGGWLPLTPRVVETRTFSKWLTENRQFGTFLEILESPNCKPMPSVPFLQFLNDQIGRAEDRAVRGILSPKEALAELERNLAEEMRKRAELGYEDGVTIRGR